MKAYMNNYNQSAMNRPRVECVCEDGRHLWVDLRSIEDALQGGGMVAWYLDPETGNIAEVFKGMDDLNDQDEEIDEDEEQWKKIDESKFIRIDQLESWTQFRWMEDFAGSLQSVPLRMRLLKVLRERKPFANFRYEVAQEPAMREYWYRYRDVRLKEAAIGFLESLGWTITKIEDYRQPPAPPPPKPAALDAHAPITDEERDWILRGAWEIEGRGGRTQLALLLKGSKDKKIIQHGLVTCPAYGCLKLLTIPEITDRIDQLVHEEDLVIQYSGELPLVYLGETGWKRIEDWAYKREAEGAAQSDSAALDELLLRWRNRPRDQQKRLVSAVQCLPPEQAQRVLTAWRPKAGQEVGRAIEAALNTQRSR